MPLPERVLIDTSAFYALLSTRDQFHDRARDAYERLIDREQKLWTTSYALVETTALLHHRLGFQAISDFSEWHNSDLEVFWIYRQVHAEAWGRFISNRGQGLSFVDWTTVIVSQEIGAYVFTFDSGFAKQGCPVVPR